MKSINIDTHVKKYKDCDPGQLYQFINKLKELADELKAATIIELESQLESLKSGEPIEPIKPTRKARKQKEAE